MKRSQNGSAGFIVVILAIAALVYWKWDWVSGLFGSKLSTSRAVAELVDYRCDRQPDGRTRIDGSVRSTSDAPIELRAITAIYDSSGKKSDSSEATIRPVPLKPGQLGTFATEAPPLPDAGSCRLEALVDSTTGKPVGYSGRRR